MWPCMDRERVAECRSTDGALREAVSPDGTLATSASKSLAEDALHFPKWQCDAPQISTSVRFVYPSSWMPSRRRIKPTGMAMQ